MLIKIKARAVYGFIAVAALLLTSVFAWMMKNNFSSVQVSDTSLYILDILVSQHNISRFKIAEKSWIKGLKKEIPSAVFAVGSTYYVDGYQTVIYKRDPQDNYRAFSLIKPFVDGMKDFIENTNKRWFLRVTDDVFINTKGLKAMIKELEDSIDPINEVSVKGDLIKFVQNNSEVSFLHGGSGWLMSRKAVMCYLRLEKEMETLFERTGDDVIVSRRFQKNLEWNLSLMGDPRFVGTPLDNFSIHTLQDIKKFDMRVLPNCTYSQITAKVHDIVVWHSGEPSMLVVREGPKIFKQRGLDDVYLQPGYHQRNLQLCLCENKTKIL
jgi:hypothetical protein